MRKPSYIPTLERLEDRILLSAGPLSAALLPLVEPPMSDCVEMRTMEQTHGSMEILMSQERCCTPELDVHFEHGELVVHLPPAFEGHMVRIEGRGNAVVVGHDGHAHLPFAEPAGTIILTITNQEGKDIPFLRVTHDGHGTVTNYKCLTDLHKLMKEEHEIHLPHASHIETHPPHILHEEHTHPIHIPHLPHTEHLERHENHVPHPLHREEEHQEPSLLEEHEPMGEDRAHQERNRSMDQRERENRALFEEAFDWGSWGGEEPMLHSPVTAQGEQPAKKREDPPPPDTPELWPIFGSATVAAAALAGAFALERRARRKD